MAIIINFRADTSSVVKAVQEVEGQVAAFSDQSCQAVASVTDKMQELNEASALWTEAMGVDAMLSGLERIGSMLGSIGSSVGSVFAAAASKEDMATQLGTMFGNQAVGSALADSLENLATNGVVPLQELQSAAGALIGTFSDPGEIAHWVGVFADISAGSKLSASRLAELTARLDDMGKAEFTELANAGVPIFQALAEVLGVTTAEVIKLSTEGQISRDNLLAAFESMTAEGEKFHKLNSALSDTTAGSWATLAASWQEVLAAAGSAFNDIFRPILQFLAKGLQQYKDAFARLVKFAVTFVMTMSLFKAGALAKSLYTCVSAMLAMNTAGKGLLGVFRSIGKVGWILLITTAVEALSFLYDKFFGSDKEDAEQAEIDEYMEEQERRAEEEKAAAEREAAAAAEELAAAQREELEAKRKEARATLDAAESVEEFNKALRNMDEELLEGYDEDSGRRAAKVREEQAAAKLAWEELQKRNTSRLKKETEEDEKKRVEAFGGLSREDQVAHLLQQFAQWGVQGDFSSVDGMRAGVGAVMQRAAEAGMTPQYEQLESLMRYVDAFAGAEKKRAETATQKAAARADKLREIQLTTRRQELQMAGDADALAAFDDEQQRSKLSAGYQAAGLSKQEADFYAAQQVQRKRALEQQDGSDSKSNAQIIGTSLSSVGGGFAIRLGDAQLTVARKQLDTLGALRSTVDKILGKVGLSGIPVTA